MAKKSARPSTAARTDSLPRLPLAADHWQRMTKAMNLAAREAQVAELMICGARDKEAAAIMGITVSTVRTILNRIYAKTKIHRHEFFVHILRLAHEHRDAS